MKGPGHNLGPSCVLILGSEGALGSALVSYFLQNKWFVIGLDVHKKSKHPISYYCVDFRNELEVQKSVAWIMSLNPLPDSLISTIAQFGNDDRSHFSWESFYEKLQINLVHLSLFCVALSRLYIERAHALRLVLVGSAAANVGSLDIAYSVSKAGLNGLVISLSKCFAANKIITIGINPGIFNSSMSASVPEERQHATILATHLKRKGTLNEMVDLISYAAQNAPEYLTGSIININGGQYSC